MSALMDKEESSAESFSSESRKEVCLMTKEESGSSQVARNKNCQDSSDERARRRRQARRKRKQNKKEVNLCLMAKEEDDASSVSFCPSLNAENYSQLLQVFKETHEEANRLAILNNRLKGLKTGLKTESRH